MRVKLFCVSILVCLFCNGSSYQSVLQPHFTLSLTSIELGMDEEFDPYAYVLKNGKSIGEEDKQFIVIDGELPHNVPGDYEITYNQYMSLQIRIKDTEKPNIEVNSFSWGLGLPFTWDKETLKKVKVSDNFTEDEELRKNISCDNIDTAYLGEKEVSCSVKDEAGNEASVSFSVFVEKTDSEAYTKFKDLADLPYSTVQKEEIVQVLALINQERLSAKLQPVTLGDMELMNITLERSKEVQQLFSHNRPNGQVCYTILEDHKYSYQSVGENIAKGQQSALEVTNDWMDSSDHRSIILTSEFTKVGISVLGEGEEKVWTLIFVH